jgi:hypothetical protein
MRHIATENLDHTVKQRGLGSYGRDPQPKLQEEAGDENVWPFSGCLLGGNEQSNHVREKKKKRKKDKAQKGKGTTTLNSLLEAIFEF